MVDLRTHDVKYLPGVGPKRAELLARELHIRTLHDLLYHFPFRYIDRSNIHHINEISGDMPFIQLRGRFIHFGTAGEGAKRRLMGLFTDGTGTIEVVWFQRIRAIQESVHTGVEYLLFGKPASFRNHYSIAHPELDPIKPGSESAGIPAGLRGVYSLTESLIQHGVGQRVMQRLLATLIDRADVRHLPEILPRSIVERRRLMSRGDALAAIHLPSDIYTLNRAQWRLKYEELLLLELHILRYIRGTTERNRGYVFSSVGQHFNDYYHNVLPFPLTGAQKRVVREIRNDLRSGFQMNRLLQGDVGSGKTVVALMTALLAIDNGFQACLMAPTEILATQHYQSLCEQAERVGVRTALLTGSTRKREREAIHTALLDGSLHLLIGTHALIEESVQFARLGLAIIDEQHRFGVAQRARLWRKSALAPHVLVMTATPIPRTLAMTVYGDLDVSVIDELPPGRKPVTTVMRYENDHLSVYRFVAGQLRLGRQAYFVYPLIEENEKLDLRALEEGYDLICENFPDCRVAYVHGRMKAAEKDHQMQLFAGGQAEILVATTVIEVGVNVPNASVMVIENAERFGLSQLHQLRGRVGRGADQSFCILMTKHNIKSETRHRLDVMTRTNDGFVVAEEDMQLRGPGDMEGTAQSGIAFGLKIADLATDGAIVQAARDDAVAILQADPELTGADGRQLDAELHHLFDRSENWSQIS